MSAANQQTNRVSKARLRQLQKQAQGLVDARERAEEDILVFIHEGKEENVANAALAGMFAVDPGGIPRKAVLGAEIKTRRTRRKGAPEPDA